VTEVLATAVSVPVGLLLALVLGVDLAPEVTLIDDDPVPVPVPVPEVVGVPDVVGGFGSLSRGVVGGGLAWPSAGGVAEVSDWLAAGRVAAGVSD